MLFRRFLHHRWKIEKQDAKPLRLIFLDHRLKMSFLHCFNAMVPSPVSIANGLLILTVIFCLTRELTGWGSDWTT